MFYITNNFIGIPTYDVYTLTCLIIVQHFLLNFQAIFIHLNGLNRQYKTIPAYRFIWTYTITRQVRISMQYFLVNTNWGKLKLVNQMTEDSAHLKGSPFKSQRTGDLAQFTAVLWPTLILMVPLRFSYDVSIVVLNWLLGKL